MLCGAEAPAKERVVRCAGWRLEADVLAQSLEGWADLVVRASGDVADLEDQLAVADAQASTPPDRAQEELDVDVVRLPERERGIHADQFAVRLVHDDLTLGEHTAVATEVICRSVAVAVHLVAGERRLEIRVPDSGDVGVGPSRALPEFVDALDPRHSLVNRG